MNPFRCKPIHKKAIFAVLTDDELQPLFTGARARGHRRPRPLDAARAAKAARPAQGQRIDLAEFIARATAHELVLKPNDEYGGKGVFIGWEASETEWEEALATALREPRTSCRRRWTCSGESFPELVPGTCGFRDLVVDLDPFVFQGEVEGFLTRLSGTSLANVTSGGGQVPAFLIEPAPDPSP